MKSYQADIKQDLSQSSSKGQPPGPHGFSNPAHGRHVHEPTGKQVHYIGPLPKKSVKSKIGKKHGFTSQMKARDD